MHFLFFEHRERDIPSDSFSRTKKEIPYLVVMVGVGWGGVLP